MKKIINFIKKIFGISNKKTKIPYQSSVRITDEYEKRILLLINEYRLSIGLKELKENQHINSISYQNNLRMIKIGEINHNGSSIRFDEIKHICNANYVSENLAYNYNDSESLVSAWIKSEKHLQNIKYKDLTHFGISVTSNLEHKKFYTMMFAYLNNDKL